MATSITIAPTLGHAPLFTQAGVGAAPGYDAIDLRRIAEAGGAFQEGVFDATGWKVTQNSGGANMSVDVASNAGLAVIAGDSVTKQSWYVIPPHSAVADLDIGANATGNPRIDQIILQVRDTTHDGSTFNDVRVLVLAGTATSGATLENRAGAASLPVSAIRLADVLVANGAASITTSVIRDRRPWARGAYATGALSGNATSTSSTLAEINAATLQKRIECSGAQMLLELHGVFEIGNPDLRMDLACFVDSGNVGARNQISAVTNKAEGFAAVVPYTPSAGTHLFSWRFASDDDSTTVTVHSGATAVYREVATVSAANGTS